MIKAPLEREGSWIVIQGMDSVFLQTAVGRYVEFGDGAAYG